MTIKNKFNIGEIVYVKVDIDQLPGMVTAIEVLPYTITYRVDFGNHSGYRYEFELSKEKDELIKIVN